jgi:hypothetical protein
MYLPKFYINFLEIFSRVKDKRKLIINKNKNLQ